MNLVRPYSSIPPGKRNIKKIHTFINSFTRYTVWQEIFVSGANFRISDRAKTPTDKFLSHMFYIRMLELPDYAHVAYLLPMWRCMMIFLQVC